MLQSFAAGPIDTGSLVSITADGSKPGHFAMECTKGPSGKCFPAGLSGPVVGGVYNGFTIPGAIRADLGC